MVQTVIHRAATRGHSLLNWLDSHHSFSFGYSYYDPDRLGFGSLRVLNDDTVAEGKGFGSHPHSNMEIISIPLEGEIKHQDSMKNSGIIRKGDVQVMSAGTGVYHSEYNANKNCPVKFLQIWIKPNKKDVVPRYDQISLAENDRLNRLQQILSPNKEDEGVWIHQDAWMHITKLDNGVELEYQLKKQGNGVYAFVLFGQISVGEHILSPRDGLGISDTNSLFVKALSQNAEVLLIEVPME
eukprot:TRINITY_DN15809_c0_g1_i1.p1 TRINITY_DN15809_c0_g1~~TRINITY_DN15809_c0_g1_i1.p1  ORF type:complete len:240 (+),score=35.55 TRINITY_DN15809_c0_g1_i1:67-786(+)